MESIAREAGVLLMDYFDKHIKIEYKGDADLVTAADRKSEALIRERIHRLWPDHDVLGEEGGLRDTGSEYRWYVDPLDGTTNFAHGYPVFCVSLALEHKDEMIAGLCFDPTRNETFTAERGKGSRLNGSPIHVSKTTKLAESLVATGFPSHKRHKNPNIHFYHQITLRTHGVRRADTAAGVLVVEEAGGRVTNFSGGPFQLNSRETLASNGIIHDALLQEFRQIFAGRDLDPLPDPREYAKNG